MRLVLPEIDEVVAEETRIRNAVGRGDDGARLGEQHGIARIAFEQCEAARILGAHPGESPRPVDILEPEKGVVVAHRAPATRPGTSGDGAGPGLDTITSDS